MVKIRGGFFHYNSDIDGKRWYVEFPVDQTVHYTLFLLGPAGIQPTQWKFCFPTPFHLDLDTLPISVMVNKSIFQATCVLVQINRQIMEGKVKELVSFSVEIALVWLM